MNKSDDPTLSVQLEQHLLDGLKAAAMEDRRTIRGELEMIIEDWLKTRTPEKATK